MAKMVKSESYTKAYIYRSPENGAFMIDECDKDEVRTYSVGEIFRRWEEEEGVSITIKKDYELDPTGGEEA